MSSHSTFFGEYDVAYEDEGVKEHLKRHAEEAKKLFQEARDSSSHHARFHYNDHYYKIEHEHGHHFRIVDRGN